MIVAVIIPTDKNTLVAVIERFENLAIPHTPWPLVQPLPNTVPKPTSSPATISVNVENLGTFGGSIPKKVKDM